MSLARWTLLLVTLAALVLPAPALANHVGPLAGQWHLDTLDSTEEGDILPDSSGHALDLVGAQGAHTLDSPGRFGSYLSENSNSPLQTTEDTRLAPQRVTLLAWVRRSDTGAFQYIIGRGVAAACGASSYGLLVPAPENDGDGLVFQVRGLLGQVVTSPKAPSLIWNGDWRMVAGVYDGSRVRLYVDGTEVGSGTAAPGLTIDYALPINTFYADGYPSEGCPGANFSGGIDEVRLYDRALSPTEIGRLASATGGTPPTLVTDPPPPAPPPSGGAGGSAPPTVNIGVPPSATLGAITIFKAFPSFAAKSFGWDLNSDGKDETVCPGHAPTLETRLGSSGVKRITVTALTGGGLAAKAVGSITVPKIKSIGKVKKSADASAVKSLRKRKKVPLAYKCVQDLKNFPRFDFTAVGDTGGGGGPPPGCSSTIQFDFIQAVGCLDRVSGISDIPFLELPILDEVIGAWNATPKLREVFNKACFADIAAGKRPKGSCPAKTVINRSETKAILPFMDLQVSRKPVRINGLDFIPAPGAAIVLAPQISRVISAGALVKAGSIPLKAGKINLDVEQGKLPGGKNLRESVPLGSFDAKKDLKIAGFPLDGQIDATMGNTFITLRGGKRRYPSNIKIRLKLPKELSLGGGQPASFAVNLSTDNENGLKLDDFKVRIPSIFIGPLRISDAFFNYTRFQDAWDAGGNIILGDAALRFAPPPDLNGIAFKNGSITRAGANLKFGSPIPPPQVFPGVFLDEIGFGIRFEPTVLRGEVLVSALKTARIRGAVLVAFPTGGRPYTLTQGDAGAALAPLAGRTFRSTTIAAGGQVNIVVPAIKREIPLGSGYFLYSAPDYLALGGRVSFDYPGMSINGSVDGEFAIRRGAFNLGGRVEACIFGLACPSVEGLVSSKGVAGCGQIRIKLPFLPAFTARPGAGYRYGDSWPKIWLIDGCKTSPYRAQVARASQSGVRTVTIRKGLPSAMIRLDGRAGAAPRVKVTAPDGDTVSSTASGLNASNSHRLRILGQDPPGITWIGVQGPRAGQYRIETLPGSTPITKVSTADGLPPAKIRAKVSGKRTRRKLSYSVLRRAGQRVTFEEQGAATARVLGSTTGGKGSLRFKPAIGPGGTRRIVARVELDGLPSEKLTIARFRVRDTLTPSRVRKLRVKRSRTAVLVRFRAARNARAYQVVVSRRNGTRRLYRLKGSRRSLRVKLASTDSGRVVVMAVGPTGVTGRSTGKRFKFRVRPATKFQKYKRGKGKLPKRKRRR